MPRRHSLARAASLALVAAAPLLAQPRPADRWAEVDRLAAATARDARLPGMALLVFDAHDRPVVRRRYGEFATDRPIAVASAAKLVAALAILTVVDAGALSLEATTGAVLGWRGAAGTITLRHLLSFTSGLAPAARCTRAVRTTLARCVEEIGRAPLTASPGTRYDYGSTHLHVAARMAEVATGRAWADLVREQLLVPLGITREVRWATWPRQDIGRDNPLIAGGLRITTDDYATLLAAVFHHGRHRGLRMADTTLVVAMGREPFPAAIVGASPMRQAGQPFRYGLGAWLECDTPAQGCARLSSPGAFGFTPWLDREAGYYAIVAMETRNGDDGRTGVVRTSVDLAQRLGPAIRRALGR